MSLEARRIVMRWTAVAILSWGGSAGVGAQAEDPLDQPWYRPGIHEEEFEQVVAKLNFDDETTEALFRAMYEEFVTRHRAAATAAVARSQAIGEEAQRWREEHPDSTSVDEPEWDYRATWEAWLAERAAIETQFEEDIALFLGPEQAATWRRITQGIRREQALLHNNPAQNPMFVWVIDLEDILDKLKILPNPEQSAALNAWSNEFDSALRRYDDERNRTAEWAKTFRGGPIEEMSDAEFEEWFNAWWRPERARHELSLTSRRWASTMAALMNQVDSDRFVAAARRKAAPQAFRPTPVESLRLELDDLPLSVDQKSEIARIIDEQYVARQQTIRLRLLEAYEKWVTADAIAERWRDWYQGIRAGEVDPSRGFQWEHSTRPIWIENRQLSLETCRAIRALIPPEEFEALPFSVRLWLSWWEE